MLLHWLSRSTLGIVCHPPSCGLVPRLGGSGRQNFSRSRLARRTLHTQPAVLKALHWNLLSVVPHARGVVENLFSTASGPVSTVLRSRSGAAFCCWLGTWFHTTLLCCNGPCPHDPPRCRLNSSPSHTDAMRNLPQFANSLGISTVLPCYCIGFHALLWKLCATPLLVDWCHGWVGWGTKFPNNEFTSLGF